MAKFSQKVMGKEVGSASVYAEPHTMSGKAEKIAANPGKEPNRSRVDTVDVTVGNLSKSAGDEKIKTDGIKMRGTGAATKGVMSRGPMA
jgi:hypothetical protein